MRPALPAACVLTLALAASPAPAQVPSAPGELVLDLVVRSEIEIAAPPAEVWPHLLDLPAWKASLLDRRRVAGAPGAEGETFLITMGEAGASSSYFVETVRLAPPHRWIIKLFSEDRRSLVGYAAFELRPRAGGTHLVYDVGAQSIVPAVPGVAAADARRQAEAATLAKLDAEHRALKKLVEGSAR